MQFSPNFASSEFEKSGAKIPEDCYPVFTVLCVEILEPMREFAGRPLLVTSGFRTPESNESAHGIKGSEHIATDRYCAGDVTIANQFGAMMSNRAIFDWARNNPKLRFHQLILEHGKNGSTIIHVSINLDKPGVRSVLEGAEHNAEKYVAVDHVQFTPDSQENA